jgi:hypothetical protein
MTTKAQKLNEERYVKMFLEGGTEYASIDDDEPPDLWVRRSTAPDVAVEVTEYHPQAEGLQGIPRKEVEERWWIELRPLLNRERQVRPALENVKAHLEFKDRRLPKKSEHVDLASELIRLVEAIAPDTSPAQAIEVKFVPRANVPFVRPRFGRSKFLVAEDWPEVSKHVSWLQVSRWPSMTWPPWLCQNVAVAWPAPSVQELRRILEGKAKKARGYNLGGAPCGCSSFARSWATFNRTSA